MFICSFIFQSVENYLKMMVKLNSRQCDGFIAIVTNLYYCTFFFFFIFHTWKTNVYHFDIESSACIYFY